MTSTNLGRLEQVELRMAWATEAADFTPWLALEENIALLGETIGLELELEAQEKEVGPFRADILCKDTVDGHWVLIENQLERTDHTHLGQLMTYAAGLNAVTIVWIAQRFAEEHRAALDWLNEISDDSINFFGLEVELWRIGESAIAPKFNVVSKPNDWTKRITSAATRIETDSLTPMKQLQFEYWQCLRDVLLSRKGPVRAVNALPQSWLNFSIGRSNFVLMCAVNTRDNWITVSLVMHGVHAKPHFQLLQRDRGAIEVEISNPLEWRELPGKKESQIVLRQKDIDPTDRQDWRRQHTWMAEMLERFHRAFSNRVKQLDAGDFLSDENTV